VKRMFDVSEGQAHWSHVGQVVANWGGWRYWGNTTRSWASGTKKGRDCNRLTGWLPLIGLSGSLSQMLTVYSHSTKTAEKAVVCYWQWTKCVMWLVCYSFFVCQLNLHVCDNTLMFAWNQLYALCSLCATVHVSVVSARPISRMHCVVYAPCSLCAAVPVSVVSARPGKQIHHSIAHIFNK
jgi:hypothetical protein